MIEIVIKTQKELDALPDGGFAEYTRIIIQNDVSIGRIVVKRSWDNSSVEAMDNSSVEARGNSSVEAMDNSSVVAWDNSSVVAWDNSSVEARGNSSVEAMDNSSVVAWDNSSVVAWDNSSVEAMGNSSVVAMDNSSVVAWDNSSVVAWDNSSVEAMGNSSVVAMDNSSVVAWDNSSVVAMDNSSVEAMDNSSVVARDNSSVVARGNVGIHLTSVNATVVLYMFAVCWAIAKGKVQKKSKTATVITPKTPKGTSGWLKSQGVPKNGKSDVVVFKRVSTDLKTQEGTANETIWEIGKTLSHSTWDPTSSECGAGKFHACSRPYFCDQFRSNAGDKYIAIKVNVKDLHAWDKDIEYPYKIAFKKGTVLYECDKFGKKVSA